MTEMSARGFDNISSSNGEFQATEVVVSHPADLYHCHCDHPGKNREKKTEHAISN